MPRKYMEHFKLYIVIVLRGWSTFNEFMIIDIHLRVTYTPPCCTVTGFKRLFKAGDSTVGRRYKELMPWKIFLSKIELSNASETQHRRGLRYMD